MSRGSQSGGRKVLILSQAQRQKRAFLKFEGGHCQTMRKTIYLGLGAGEVVRI